MLKSFAATRSKEEQAIIMYEKKKQPVWVRTRWQYLQDLVSLTYNLAQTHARHIVFCLYFMYFITTLSMGFFFPEHFCHIFS